MLTSMPASPVTVSTILSRLFSSANAHKAAASLQTPVDVSACTNASTFACGLSLMACFTFSRSTALPQSSTTMIGCAPIRITFSCIRPPNAPFWQMMT